MTQLEFAFMELYKDKRKCNIHYDCDEADRRAKSFGRYVDHCDDDCCEECFGY